jgi:hypothetical protein
MHILPRPALALCFSLLFAAAAAASQSKLANEFQLIPAGAPSAATMGHAVAISGDTAVLTMQIGNGSAEVW